MTATTAPALTVGTPVVTDLGTGVIVRLNRDSVTVQYDDGPKKRMPLADVTVDPTRPVAALLRADDTDTAEDAPAAPAKTTKPAAAVAPAATSWRAALDAEVRRVLDATDARADIAAKMSAAVADGLLVSDFVVADFIAARARVKAAASLLAVYEKAGLDATIDHATMSLVRWSGGRSSSATANVMDAADRDALASVLSDLIDLRG